MPAQDLLTLGYNVAEFDKQTTHVIDGLNKVIATAEKVDSTIINLSNFSGGVKEFKQASEELKVTQSGLVKSAQDYNKALIDQAKIRVANANATKAETAAEKEVVKLIKEELTYEQALAKEKQKGATQAQAEARIADKLSNDYYQLGQALKDAENKYKSLYLTAGKNNPLTKQALKDAQGTRAILNDIDQNLGNYQRNVGNYASGFNGLNTSVQQILREAPSAAVSLNTFFLAISNNLPMLFDEIQRANAGLKELKEAAVIANAELANQTKLQQETAIASKEASLALNAQVEALLANSAASAEQAAIVQKQLEEQIALSVANNETAEAIALQTEELLIHAGIAEKDAAAIKLQVTENAKLASASLKATTALEAQTVATAEANAAAAVQPSVLKRLGSALFSFNTLLTVGVLALTLFGGKLIDLLSSLFKGKDAFDKAAEGIKTLNEAFKDSALPDAIKNINELKINIGLAKDGFLKKDDVLKEYNKTIGITTGEVKNLDEAEQALAKNADAYIKFTLLKAAANLALDGAAKSLLKAEQDRQEGLREQADLAKKPLTNKALVQNAKDQNAEIVKDSENTAKKQVDIAQEFQKQAAEIAKQFHFNFFPPDATKDTKKTVDVAFETAKNELERKIKELQDFVNNGSVLFDERNVAADQLAKTQIELIDLVKDHEIKNGKARVIANQEAAYKIEDIATELMGNLDKIFKESKLNLFPEGEIIKPADVERLTRPVLDGFKFINDAILKNLKDTATQGANLFGTAFQQGLFELSEKYNQGLISRQKYEKGVADLTKKYTKESLKYAIDEAEKRLSLLDKETDAYKELAKAIAAARAAAHKGTDMDWQELADNVARISEAITTISNIKFDNQKADLEELTAQEEKRYEQERQNIEQSVASNEEKAQQQILLDAKHAAQQEEYARRQREVDNKKAEFDKAVGIMNIIIGTAASVAKATTVFEKIAFAAIGAAQLAAAIATQVPHYAEGLDRDKPGHYGVYGEAGAELVKKPGKAAYISDSPTLDFIPYGTRIIPLSTDEMNENLYHGMMRNTAKVVMMKQKADKPLIDIKALGKEITSSLKKQKRPYVKVINNIGNDLAKNDYIRRNLL